MAAVRDLPYGGCLDLPPQVSLLNESELSGEKKDKLFSAITGLLNVYAENSPELLIEYMAAHGEVPHQRSVERLREVVAEIRSVPVSSIRLMRSNEVLISFWKESETDSNWAGILDRSNCYQCWKCTEVPSDDTRGSLGAGDRKIFQNISNVVHQFDPVRPLASTLDVEGSLLFADVKVVIRLAPELYNKSLPYYLRFWYDPVQSVWHPYQMGYVDVAIEGGSPKHIF
jgi:hypothetical protein